MSELQGAVAVAQMDKLRTSVSNRQSAAQRLTEALRDITGLATPPVTEGDAHAWWKYCLRVDDRLIRGGAPGLAVLLKQRGIASAPRYIQKPAFQCEIFQKQRTFGQSRFPFTLARPEALDYDPARFPGVFAALESILVLPWNERYTAKHVAYIAACLRQAVHQLVSPAA
jgi:dTDP-4-amino-4,6-dideoxygalactose transaminase